MKVQTAIRVSLLFFASLAMAQTGQTADDGVRNIADFPGESIAEQVRAACASFHGQAGIVMIPGSMSDGALGIFPDNCTVLDFRGRSGPNEEGAEEKGWTKGLLLRGRYTHDDSRDAGHNMHMQPLHVHTDFWAGGENDCCANGFHKSYVSGVASTLAAHTPGQKFSFWGWQSNFSDGDNIAGYFIADGWGGTSAWDDEGTIALRGQAYQMDTIFTAKVVANHAGVLSYSHVVHEETRGEKRLLIITTPAKVYSAGSIGKITGAPPVVNGIATEWARQFGAGKKSDLCFSLDSETQQGVKEVIPIASIDSDTRLTLTYTLKNRVQGWEVADGGPYQIFRCGVVTSLAQFGGLTVSPYADFTAGDAIEMPLAYNHVLIAGRVTAKQQIRQIGNASIAFDVNNVGTYRMDRGLNIVGLFKRGIVIGGRQPDEQPSTEAAIHYSGKAPGTMLRVWDQQKDNFISFLQTTENIAGTVDFGFDRKTDSWQFQKSRSPNAAVSSGGVATFKGGVVAPTYQTTLTTPASSHQNCTAGQMWADADYVYVCTAPNTIKRAALSAF